MSVDPATERAEPEVLVHCTPAYRIGRALTRWGWKLYFRPRLEGRDRLPQTGGALLCANHQSFLDIPLVAHLTPRHVSFVARANLANSGFLAWIMRESGTVLIHPGKPDRAALRQMVAHLEAGDLVTIFPEGARTWDGSIGELRAGALLAARQAGVPVYPIGIRGAFEAWPRKRKWPRPRRVAARVGQPIDADAPDALEQLRASLAELVGDGRFDSLAPIP